MDKMRITYLLLFFWTLLLSSCSRYTVTNSSSTPIKLDINYHFTDSSYNSIPFRIKQLDKEVINKRITNLKSDISGMTGKISFDVLTEKATQISFLILAARYQKHNKANPNMTILITQPSSKVDTVFQIVDGMYIVNKFKGNIMNCVSPNKFYHYDYGNSN